jgi:protoporphyrinogen oxidase
MTKPTFDTSTFDTIILGGGIAGLTAAYELGQQGQRVLLVERGREVGGLARTFVRDGYRFDIGGHRFHSHNPAVVQWVQKLVGDDLLTVPRRSHIYLNGRFANYPIEFPNALALFPLAQSAKMAGSYLAAHLKPHRQPDHSFEEWVVRRFGRAMYEIFFRPYTEKVWGIPCHQLSADWAAQRIGLPNLWQTIKHALRPAAQTPATAITQFYYPRHGFGQIPHALRQAICQQGGQMMTQTQPTQIVPQAKGFGLVVAHGGRRFEVQTADLISTIPLPALLPLLPQTAENQHMQQAAQLEYRSLVCVFLTIRKAQITADSWTYFPDAQFTFGRTHEPKNWSMAMVPDAHSTSLGVEIFTSQNEAIWRWTDEQIVAQVTTEFQQLGWFTPTELEKSWVLRIPYAYPIYRLDYQEKLAQTKAYLGQWPQLHLVGRTGSFRYMNSDGVIEDVFRFVNGEEGGRPFHRHDPRWV